MTIEQGTEQENNPEPTVEIKSTDRMHPHLLVATILADHGANLTITTKDEPQGEKISIVSGEDLFRYRHTLSHLGFYSDPYLAYAKAYNSDTIHDILHHVGRIRQPTPGIREKLQALGYWRNGVETMKRARIIERKIKDVRDPELQGIEFGLAANRKEKASALFETAKAVLSGKPFLTYQEVYGLLHGPVLRMFRPRPIGANHSRQ